MRISDWSSDVCSSDLAGLFDVSHMGQLLFSGEDADKALEALLPGDIIGLKDGRMRYSLLLDGDGGILDDLMVTRRSDGIYIVVNGATKYDDIAYLREHLPDEITINHMNAIGRASCRESVCQYA